MNRRRTLKGLALSAFACIAIYSCTHVSGSYISSHGSRAGSSMKDNCMNCHQTGATYGGFIVAGTVVKEGGSTRNPNGTVYLFTVPNGVLGKDSVIATIEVDGVGNFYTTHPIDLSKGFYPAVNNASGDDSVHHMQSETTIGSCNSCHGVSQANIYVK